MSKWDDGLMGKRNSLYHHLYLYALASTFFLIYSSTHLLKFIMLLRGKSLNNHINLELILSIMIKDKNMIGNNVKKFRKKEGLTL